MRDWEVSLCACWGSRPYGLLPFCAACTPCVPLARAGARGRVASYKGLVVVTGIIIGLIWLLRLRAATVTTPAPAGKHYGASTGKKPAPAASGATFPHVPVFVLFPLIAVIVLYVRRRLVRKYQLGERASKTLILACCCMPCSIAQQAMHVDLVEYGAVQTDCSLKEEHPLMSGRYTSQSKGAPPAPGDDADGEGAAVWSEPKENATEMASTGTA